MPAGSSVKIDRRDFLGASLVTASIASSAAMGEAGALTYSSAMEAARAIRRRSVSSAELTKHMLDRIESHNPRLNAYVTVVREQALARAQAADEALARGDWWGPFHGVPCDIKDTFETAGVRTTAGAEFLKDYVPKRDAAIVERLRAAGAVILGKTNTPEMAGDWQSYNKLFGTTNNPWDIKRTPGGSTGGGAAALAAGMSYLSMGSDIGGSIRIPSSFCGIYGHKPTLEVVSQRGHIPPPPGGPPSPPLDLPVAGPLARSATDLKTALEIIGGPDGDAAKAYQWSLPAARGGRLKDYRVGFLLDDKLCPVTAEVGNVLSGLIEALGKSGSELKEGWPEGVIPSEQYDTYRSMLAAFLNAVGPQEEPARATPPSGDPSGHRAISKAARSASYRQYWAWNVQRMKARAIWQDFFRTFDAFLMPVAFLPAFPHDHRPWDERSHSTPLGSRPYEDLLFWISFATLTGLPATVAPVGVTSGGLPVGVQIVGPYLEDATPIQFAGLLADVAGGFRSPKGM